MTYTRHFFEAGGVTAWALVVDMDDEARIFAQCSAKHSPKKPWTQWLGALVDDVSDEGPIIIYSEDPTGREKWQVE